MFVIMMRPNPESDNLTPLAVRNQNGTMFVPFFNDVANAQLFIANESADFPWFSISYVTTDAVRGGAVIVNPAYAQEEQDELEEVASED